MRAHALANSQRLAMERNSVLVDQIVIIGIGSWKSQHSPAHFVFVATVDGIGEQTFHCVLQEELEKYGARHAVQIDAALFQARKVTVLFGRGQLIKCLSQRREVCANRGNRPAKQFRRCVLKLKTLRRRARAKRPVSVAQFATPPRSSHLQIDVVDHARFRSTGPMLVTWNEALNSCLKESFL